MMFQKKGLIRFMPAKVISTLRRLRLAPIIKSQHFCPSIDRSQFVTNVTVPSPREFHQIIETRVVTEESCRKMIEEEETVRIIRSEIWEGLNINKRARNENGREVKRCRTEQGAFPIYATQFSTEDIAAEERRPKKKAAVLLGYSGTSYHGMQLSETLRTIEGDLFTALVAAGAISKANAADPKKSSLVRCARTDKGVHAAGNVVSLKLIVEDPNLVQKINEKLSSQIRVWGIQVTNRSFSCYTMCDSRIYEYLIPSHCFLPPHPSTYLGRKIVELADDMTRFLERQAEVATFWDEVVSRDIQPILEGLPGEVRRLIQRSLYIDEEETSLIEEAKQPMETDKTAAKEKGRVAEEDVQNTGNNPIVPDIPQKAIISETIKSIKFAYQKAKRAYRIHPTRLTQLQEALNKYLGTNNFYNYTIHKTYKDPSAKRIIKSFTVNPEPINVNGREWLSLKVHGQSFMMHQIRKMVAMAALIVRCGCDPNRITDSYGPIRIAIPKAPGLGLLLERPIFDSYNKKKAKELDKECIDFGKYEKEIEEFKQREIYDRIFREEEETNSFGLFFNHIDHFQQETFHYVTSGGLAATQPADQPQFLTGDDSGDQHHYEETEIKQQPQPQRLRRSEKDALAAVEGDSDAESIANNGEEGG